MNEKVNARLDDENEYGEEQLEMWYDRVEVLERDARHANAKLNKATESMTKVGKANPNKNENVHKERRMTKEQKYEEW